MRFGRAHQAHMLGANGVGLELFQFLDPPGRRSAGQFPLLRDRVFSTSASPTRTSKGSSPESSNTADDNGQKYGSSSKDGPAGSFIARIRSARSVEALSLHSYAETFANMPGWRVDRRCPSMIRLCPNLHFMYREAPFLERFAAAARDGFAGVEPTFPYDHAATEIRGRRQIGPGLRSSNSMRQPVESSLASAVVSPLFRDTSASTSTRSRRGLPTLAPSTVNCCCRSRASCCPMRAVRRPCEPLSRI